MIKDTLAVWRNRDDEEDDDSLHAALKSDFKPLEGEFDNAHAANDFAELALGLLEELPAEETAKPERAPARPYEEARSAIKALGLPVKKQAYYLRQAEAVVDSGKDYRPVVERARKAAGKSAPAPRERAQVKPPRSRQRTLDVVLDSFNAEPRWRLSQLRSRPNGHVLVVYPEEAGPDDAVAAIDVIDLNISPPSGFGFSRIRSICATYRAYFASWTSSIWIVSVSTSGRGSLRPTSAAVRNSP